MGKNIIPEGYVDNTDNLCIAIALYHKKGGTEKYSQFIDKLSPIEKAVLQEQLGAIADKMAQEKNSVGEAVYRTIKTFAK